MPIALLLRLAHCLVVQLCPIALPDNERIATQRCSIVAAQLWLIKTTFELLTVTNVSVNYNCL